VILTGDIDQIDNDSLDPINNGLTQVIDKFKTSYLAGNLVLNKCERSMLAEEAVKLL
jgi:predicted ribonuclease YlaK